MNTSLVLKDSLKQRAALLKKIRQFFDKRNILEVETPLLCTHTVTDVHVHSISTGNRFLQTSPEYAMKRLLAAGVGDIYQITKAFRDDEPSAKHNPEFTLLEWYRLGFDHHQLMDEVSLFLQQTLHTPAAIKQTYQQVFISHLNIDPHNTSTEALSQCAQEQGIHITGALTPTDWLSLLFTHSIEPTLAAKTPIMIYDFPVAQAALAKIMLGNPDTAARFEVYYQGLELANGFYELTDASEQLARFKADQEKRAALNLPYRAIDPYFIDALSHGLPSCAGVALGIDRLMMLSEQLSHITEAISFPWGTC